MMFAKSSYGHEPVPVDEEIGEMESMEITTGEEQPVEHNQFCRPAVRGQNRWIAVAITCVVLSFCFVFLSGASLSFFSMSRVGEPGEGLVGNDADNAISQEYLDQHPQETSWMHSHAGNIPKLDKKKGFFGKSKGSSHVPAGSKGSQIRQHYNTIPNSTAFRNDLHDIAGQKVDIIRKRQRTNITRSRNWPKRFNHTRQKPPERTREPPDGETETDNENEKKDETDVKENTEVEPEPTHTTPAEKHVDGAAATDSPITVDNEEDPNIDETKDTINVDKSTGEAEPTPTRTRPEEKTIDGLDANGDADSEITDENEEDSNSDKTKDKTDANDNSEEAEPTRPVEKTVDELDANGDTDSGVTDGNKDDPNIAETENETDANENTGEAKPIPTPTRTRPAEEKIDGLDANGDTDLAITDENEEDRNKEQTPEWKDIKVTRTDGVQFTVLKQMDHESSSFTQGLTFANGKLYESTGLYGQSKVRILDPEDGSVLQSIDMPPDLFGEGMAYYGDEKLIQITWKQKKGFIYNANDLSMEKEFTYRTTNGQGWGITHDAQNRRFIVSDGSPYLHFWDDETLEESNPKILVTRQNGAPAKNLNELEFYKGLVLANVWYQEDIIAIDPETGDVIKEYDFSTLWPKSERRFQRADVLNGISVSDTDGELYVTGKKWNRIYRIELN